MIPLRKLVLNYLKPFIKRFYFLLILNLSAVCFSIYSEESASLQRSFKLYCMYTPEFERLYKDYFLPSIQDDFEVIAKELPQECPAAAFETEGWDRTMYRKLLLLREAILTHWNDRIFFYSDVDIVFFRPILELSLDCLANYDFVAQQGWPRNAPCAGFLIMRGNEKTLRLIDHSISLMEQGLCSNDQAAICKTLQTACPPGISWKFLPSAQFPNGKRVMKGYRLGDPPYSPNAEIEIGDSMVLFHANCCVGLENKYHFLTQVLKEYEEKNKSVIKN